MTYTKKKLGFELKKRILTESSCNEISKWAFKIYTDYGLDFEKGLDYFVLKLIAMEEGPEFFLSAEELKFIAEELLETVKLFEIVKDLEILNSENAIYAEKPWTENSIALVLPEPESGELPAEAKDLDLNYFLKVSIAMNFIRDLVTNSDTIPSLQQKCLRLIQYAINNA